MFKALGHAESMSIALSRAFRMIQNAKTKVAVPTERVHLTFFGEVCFRVFAPRPISALRGLQSGASGFSMDGSREAVSEDPRTAGTAHRGREQTRAS